jgi:hypothetical protein
VITLNLRPTTPPLSWWEFLGGADRFDIAIDGYVTGGPRFDAERCVANFNHHEEVDRLATRATCGQVLMAIRQGLFRTFRDEGGPRAAVFANDCDEDVCTSWYVLKHHAVCGQPMNPLLNRLVMMEDALDATAGAYPFPADLPVLQELAWVFEPYRQFRLSGQLDKRDARAFMGVIEDVEGRIARHLAGHGGQIPLDTRYECIGGGKGWMMVTETGAQARTGMFSDGIRAFVSVRELGHARWAYTVGRLSRFIDFDLECIYTACNANEESGTDLSGTDLWGGSDTVGGSPRIAGSRIAPDVLVKIIDGVLA